MTTRMNLPSVAVLPAGRGEGSARAPAVERSDVAQLAVAGEVIHGVEVLGELVVDARQRAVVGRRRRDRYDVDATTGRGRMDRYGRRVGEAPKTVLVYPLVRDAKRRLREG